MFASSFNHAMISLRRDDCQVLYTRASETHTQKKLILNTCLHNVITQKIAIRCKQEARVQKVPRMSYVKHKARAHARVQNLHQHMKIYDHIVRNVLIKLILSNLCVVL